jgi:hypothetical protein
MRRSGKIRLQIPEEICPLVLEHPFRPYGLPIIRHGFGDQASKDEFNIAAKGPTADRARTGEPPFCSAPGCLPVERPVNPVHQLVT